MTQLIISKEESDEIFLQTDPKRPYNSIKHDLDSEKHLFQNRFSQITSPRILDKETIQINYSIINHKIRSKVLRERMNRFQLITFNPEKLRSTSPSISKVNTSIEF